MNTFKLMRKIVTFRSLLNRLLRQPQRTEITVLSTGVVVEIFTFKNKKIISVK